MRPAVLLAGHPQDIGAETTREGRHKGDISSEKMATFTDIPGFLRDVNHINKSSSDLAELWCVASQA